MDTIGHLHFPTLLPTLRITRAADPQRLQPVLTYSSITIYLTYTPPIWQCQLSSYKLRQAPASAAGCGLSPDSFPVGLGMAGSLAAKNTLVPARSVIMDRYPAGVTKIRKNGDRAWIAPNV